MTILASTDDHLAEFEAGVLTIARYSDGHCKTMKARGIAGEFRRCLKTHTPERVIATYLRLADQAGCKWEPLYKPDYMPRPTPIRRGFESPGALPRSSV